MSRLTAPFPDPPKEIRQTFDDLERVMVASRLINHPKADIREAAQAMLDEFGDLDTLPRPWDPPTLAPTHRKQLWVWLEAVARWINSEYVWAPKRLIPGCWPQHPHLVHEIAVLACLRFKAGLALSPDPLEEWHRWSLPQFVDRMNTQIGSGCDSSHSANPTAPRIKAFNTAHYQARIDAFTADTAPVAPASGEAPASETHRHLNPVH